MADSLHESRMDRKKKKTKKRGIFKHLLKKTIMALLIIGAIGIIVAGVYLATIVTSLDELNADDLYGYQQTSFVYDYKDNTITSIHGIENRIRIPLSQIPEHVRNAFIAVEDVRFEQHSGFDIPRMFGALFQNIKAGGIVAGAGTITQQVVRNTVLTQEQTLNRKVKEIILAYQLEQQYSKDQILELYLNIIYFGKGLYGIEAASRTYFGKSTNELTVAEGALLAGIIKNPHRNSPFIDEKRSLERKDLSIDLMVKNGKLTSEEGGTAKNQKIIFAEETTPTYTHGYFMDMVLEEAADILDVQQEDLYTKGYSIYTTMDTTLQEYVEDLYTNDGIFPKSPASGNTCESALVILDTSTAELRAVLGGREYPKDQRQALNRAESRRQPGSAIKPLLSYTPAIELKNYTPVTFIKDEPVTFGVYPNEYSPSNYGGGFSGNVTMREALSESINIPAVKILNDVGINVCKSIAEKMGIEFTNNDKHLAIALGGMEEGVSPLELARGFAVLGNKGTYQDYTTIRRIEDSMGRILYERKPQQSQAISEETAFLVSSMLKTSTQTGTAKKLNGLNVAAKTGTVQLPPDGEYKNIDGVNDAWVAAYNSEYVVTVWMGFDVRTTKDYLPHSATGGTYPTKIARNVLDFIYKDRLTPDFAKPLGIIEIELDSKALKDEQKVLLATPMTPKEYVVKEYFTRGTVPTEESNYWKVPSTPSNFDISINTDGLPVLYFEPVDTFASYNIMKIDENDQDSATLKQQITSNNLEPIEWTDTEVSPGKNYGYYIVPVHQEMKLGGEFVQGPKTNTIYIEIPSRIDNNNGNDNGFWDITIPDLGDLLNPWDRQDDNKDKEETRNRGQK